jgi:hypothetical protein
LKRLTTTDDYRNLDDGAVVLRKLNYRKEYGEDIPSLLDIAIIQRKGNEGIIVEQKLGLHPNPKRLPSPLPDALWHMYHATQGYYDLSEDHSLCLLGLNGDTESHSFWELTEDEIRLHLFINTI